ncbi:hypothetical protein [Vagococcus hydrophili]|uniref:Lipoprotein n=1 Tax=Vagococcus hydrophili TaxID=2714947 RepID=A0A6G8AQN1_9ENTE|nr:hypothetical protein [Vagococcus hydrophili]QIL47233.1 hypothetical protein G7082_01150 [Vagococcus hydrophili]
MKTIKKLSILFFLLLILASCGTKPKSEYQKVIQDIYQKNGFDGKVTVTSVKNEGYLYSTVSTRVLFDYSEKVGDRDITVNNTFFFEKDSVTPSYDMDELNNKDLMDIQYFDDVIQSFRHQKEAIILKKNVETQLNKYIKLDTLHLSSIRPQFLRYEYDKYPEFKEFSKSQEDYKKDVLKNQQNKLPFNGYFDIDLKRYMKTGLIRFYIYYDNVTDDIFPDNEADLNFDLPFMIREMDVSNFYDGIYRLSYDNRTPEGGVSGGHSFTFLIINNRITRLIEE